MTEIPNFKSQALEFGVFDLFAVWCSKFGIYSFTPP